LPILKGELLSQTRRAPAFTPPDGTADPATDTQADHSGLNYSPTDTN
jgi:hypothetical protein